MKKNPIKYLIAAQPENINSLYYDKDGTKVQKQFANEFYTSEDAKDFAAKHKINLNGVTNYIVVK